VAPHIGGICGAWFYQLLVGIHGEAANDVEQDVEETKDSKNSASVTEYRSKA